MSESILLRLATQLNDGTPTGDLLAATAQAQHVAAIRKHGNSMSLETELAFDPAEKALRHMIDTLAYAVRAGLDIHTITHLKHEARCLASQVRHQRAETEALWRASKEVADGN